MLRFKSLLLACALLFAFLQSQLTAGENKVYKIGMIHWIAFAPNNVADVKGFWKELGVEVQVVNFSSNQDLNAAFENGGVDIAHDMIGSWIGMYQDGLPVTILLETDWSNGGDKIIAKKDFSPAALKGGKLGVYLNKPSVTFFLNKYLQTQGVKLSEVATIEVEPEAMTNAFIAGKYPLIVNYDPQALRAEREGNGKVVATSADYAGCIPEGYVARADRLGKMDRGDLVKIMKGWLKAVAWSNDPANWAEYMKIVNSKTFEGENPYSEKDLKEMLGAVKIHTAAELGTANAADGGLVKYLGSLQGFLKENGQLKKDFQPSEVFNNSYILESLK